MALKNKWLLLIWLLVPPIYGFGFIYLAWMLYDENIPTVVELLFNPLVLQIIFTVFWFWVGMRFTRFSHNSIKSYVIGNSIWLASFLLYLWQYVILSDESRNMFLAVISESYASPFMWSGFELAYLLESVFPFHDSDIVISYIVMIVVFTIGFLTGKVRASSKNDV